MSKLSENLKAYNTGARYAKPPKLDFVSFKSNYCEISPYHMQYTLECNIGTKFFVEAGSLNPRRLMRLSTLPIKRNAKFLKKFSVNFVKTFTT